MAMKGRMVARFLRASGLGEYMRRKGGGAPPGLVVFPPVGQLHSEVLSLELRRCNEEPVTVGQRIISFLDNWRKITSDPDVLSMVAGWKVDFTEAPVQWTELHWPRFSKMEQDKLQEEVEEIKVQVVLYEYQVLPFGLASTRAFTKPLKPVMGL